MDENQQSHPLYGTERDLVDRLLATEAPADADLVELGRLLMRYEGFPGALDLQEDLQKTLRLWGLSREQLHQRTRAIWAGGYRPGAEAAPQAVGSGFDTSDQDSP
ncbi:MAG: DUF3288 family protein [Cyanobacteria bacterium]|mgnify:FL=1|jgi:hypothetical protein|uniref:DUF3288 family protein n=1 Tax=Synechococcaceae TaxID=1890426 RepID=UPI0002001A6C|nr:MULTISPECIES: DUF3288 family protein [Synechococcaceae]MDA0727783.1 DUF3288 family protein [Cyanobacteriota bacterium]NCV91481.1 DUF3288 family protein [Synechococcaceae bacterium WB7_3xG_012]PWL22995.1 MAG: DUF3288 domain-containing protein [Synechococcus sp. XM-24]MDA0964347.1 DUF3288 family protein [Cyanobacteriota bacterium]MDA1156624.1 DUF3288 family protein [Cyanobacteriota bacterium]